MPNGIDRGWVRFCAAVDGFYARYGHWPARVRLHPNAIDFLFTPESLAQLARKIELVYDGSPFIAEDELGNRYNYGQEGFTEARLEVRAEEWLGVSPDSEAFRDHGW
ncbi:MAG: hypothetical protein JW862_07995 [Anaerolineales bacterium]|nr:hypothetical protein [Anaerolineales bacterium]